MKIEVFQCDRCKKQISGNVHKFSHYEVNDIGRYENASSEVGKRDFCEECATKVERFLELEVTKKPDFTKDDVAMSQPKEEIKKEQPKEQETLPEDKFLSDGINEVDKMIKSAGNKTKKQFLMENLEFIYRRKGEEASFKEIAADLSDSGRDITINDINNLISRFEYNGKTGRDAFLEWGVDNVEIQ